MQVCGMELNLMNNVVFQIGIVQLDYDNLLSVLVVLFVSGGVVMFVILVFYIIIVVMLGVFGIVQVSVILNNVGEDNVLGIFEMFIDGFVLFLGVKGGEVIFMWIGDLVVGQKWWVFVCLIGVEVKLVFKDFDIVIIYFYWDGLLYKVIVVMGMFEIEVEVGQLVKIMFIFIGNYVLVED